MGEVGLEVNLVSEKGQNEIPGHERRIGMAELAADEGLIVLQDAVKDARDAADLIDVALNSARKFLGVVEGELHGLSEV
ncbi:hypothetical protein V500_02093 [Pseudogymnoascus sp. VKM F-4518 (FW-2643)]|nr:hypothetical protein V500_02093 [Pseudogymnoascus sp. VKM F-4518 (FW-2643)]